MRVAWEPAAASTPRSVALSGSSAGGQLVKAALLPADSSTSGGSSSSFTGGFAGRPSVCLPAQCSIPAQGAPLSPNSEVKQLRSEVARLRTAAQQDAKERETLHGVIERLKTELRHALDENRLLADASEERKQMLDAQSAKREAAVRESALNSAKDLFKSMLEDAENGRFGAENRNSNRDLPKVLGSSQCGGHKRRQLPASKESPSTRAATHFS